MEMSMISEQAKELRKIAEEWNPNCQINPVSVTINNAADTIESLSEKLADMERPRKHYNKANTEETMTLDETIAHLNDILQSDKPWECEECKNKHIQLREWPLELKAIRERPAEDCVGGWITDEPPKESGNYFITTDTVVMGEVDSDVGYWDGESWNTFSDVYAWKPIKFPEPYLLESCHEP